MLAGILVDDPRFAIQRVLIETEDAEVVPPGPAGSGTPKAAGTSESKPLSIILPPARILTTRHRCRHRQAHCRGELDANFMSSTPARTDVGRTIPPRAETASGYDPHSYRSRDAATRAKLTWEPSTSSTGRREPSNTRSTSHSHGVA